MGKRNFTGVKNPRRVMAGKIAYERRKAAQDEADKEAMKWISPIILALFVIGLFVALAK
ncbi:hypothetical protein HU751_022510 [Pseudomonas sp. BW13M1]|uniref:Uncharacterized protein n=1 Tax=Pseudomonas peradeniyensis TaxID=2745488 RepID=A0A923G8S4_9PSED|nr:hypothetical protein [Pseudomonas peradeniyensis]MBV4507610.1 hypothetical protein [Pseudomonas peradeniyensis]